MSDTDLIHPPLLPSVIGYLVCNCILGLLSLVILPLRIWGRRMGLGVGIDDWLILVAEPLALCGIIFQGIHSGLGIGYDMPTHPELLVNLTHMLKVIYVQQIVYLLALGSIKTSMLFFYIRIFGTNKAMRVIIFATMALVGLWMVAYLLAAIFLCAPIKKQWMPTIDGTCGDQLAMDESMVITNIITDVIIMALPMYTIWNLKLRTGERFGLMAAFSLGLAVVVASIFRIVYVKTANLTENLTGTLPVSIFVSQIEPLLGIICVSIPMLAPIYKRYRRHGSSTPLYDIAGSSGGPSGMSSGRTRRNWEMKPMQTTTATGKMDDENKSLDGTGSDKNLTGAAAPHGITVQTKYTVTRE